jgi:short-subunit dehydrogenase
LSAQRVAQIGYRGLMRGKRVVVPGLGSWLATLFVRLVPNALLLEVIYQSMRHVRSRS